jgi:hypothetical protein
MAVRANENARLMYRGVFAGKSNELCRVGAKAGNIANLGKDGRSQDRADARYGMEERIHGTIDIVSCGIANKRISHTFPGF